MCVQCTCWNASETIAKMEEGSLNSVLRCIFLWSANYKVYWCTLQQGRVLVSFGIFCCFFLYEVHFGTFEQISSKFWPGEAWNRGSRCLHRVIESFHFLLNSITVHHLCSQSSSFFLRCAYWNPHHKGVAQWWQEPVANLGARLSPWNAWIHDSEVWTFYF